jgi:hypothetical protein
VWESEAVTQELPALDPEDTQPFMRVPEGFGPGPGSGSTPGSSRLPEALDWWFDPETQRNLRRGLVEPDQEREEERETTSV